MRGDQPAADVEETQATAETAEAAKTAEAADAAVAAFAAEAEEAQVERVEPREEPKAPAAEAEYVTAGDMPGPNLTACIVVWQGAPEDVQPALPLLQEAQESSTPLLCKAANLVAWFKPSICVRTRTEETSSLRDRLT